MDFVLKAQKITPKGHSLAYLPPQSGRGGKAVFISGAIPDETLKVRIRSEKRDWAAASVVEVLEPSAHRVAPECRWHGLCGGCDFMHIEGSHQLYLKKQILTSCLARQGVAHPPIDVVSGEQTHYRCRIRLHDGCFVKRGSHEGAAVSSCLVATGQLNAYLEAVSPDRRPKGQCAVFASSLLVPHRLPHCQSVQTDQVVVQSDREEDNRAAVCLLGKQVAFDVRGFFQSNMELLAKTVPQVTAGLEGSRALDLYSGVGVFALFLVEHFREVCAVERDERAAHFARENLAGKRAVVCDESAASWCKRHSAAIGKGSPSFDAAVVDPPRGGMDKTTVLWLCSSGIPNIRSLSCDPATHARDLRILCGAGYKVARMVLLDFMPQTSHVESLAYLTR